MFASCIPDVLERAGRVLIECNERLEALFRRSFPAAEVHARKKDDKAWLKQAGRIDYQVYMGSLPGLLRQRWSDFPEHGGYLRADPQRVAYWQRRLGTLGPGCKIGLMRAAGKHASRHALDPLELLPLSIPRMPLRQLQYGDCAHEIRVQRRTGWHLRMAGSNRRLHETAALVQALAVRLACAPRHYPGRARRPVRVWSGGRECATEARARMRVRRCG